jgi:peptide/nickel transport system ATP-binding protein
MTDPLLSVENLRTTFPGEEGRIRAVDDVSFTLDAGETLGLVGESGAGKSTLVRSLPALVDAPGRIEGSVRLRDPATVDRVAATFHDVADGTPTPADGDFLSVEERDADGAVSRGWVHVLAAPPEARRLVRGAGIAVVSQDPGAALNPVYTVGEQVREAVALHRGLAGDDAREATVDLLRAVDLPDPRRRRTDYPHQLSGGQQQRVAIAAALACDPAVLVCDEPTTGLDVTVQAEILHLLDSLRAERDLGVLLVSHDVGVVAEAADRVAVMYAGEVVERGGCEAVLTDPAHPYTASLLASLPSRHAPGERLPTLDGSMPTPTAPATACRFAPRCPEALPECTASHPESVPVGDDPIHTAACILAGEDADGDVAAGDDSDTETTGEDA